MADINLGVGAANSASDAYEIANSCKFNKAGSETMYRPNTNGNRRTWTSSFWIKFCGGIGSGTDTHMLYHGAYGQGTRMFTSGGTDQLYIDLCGYGDERYRWITNQVFRDRSAWYHIIWRVDTTQSSLSDRMRLYVNGEQITDWQKEADDADNDASNSGNKMPQNYDTLANLDHSGYDAMQFSYKEASIYCDMYLAEFHHCDGYSYGPTEFGKFDSNGIWVPIEANVSYGNNGCYLDFETSSNLGNDANGGTDFTLQNIAAADQATDTPTNNFCILSLPVSTYINTMGAIEGGTYMKRDGENNFAGFFGTLGFTKGKWYFESYIPSRSASYGLMEEMGIHTLGSITLGSPYYVTQMETNYYLNFHYGYTYHWNNGTRVSRAWADTGIPDLGPSAVGSTIGLAINADDGEATWYKDGSQMGTADLDMFDIHDKMQDGVFAVPFFQVYDNNLNANFGGYSSVAISSGNSDANGYGNFEYAVPSGYYAICSKNLAEFG